MSGMMYLVEGDVRGIIDQPMPQHILHSGIRACIPVSFDLIAAVPHVREQLTMSSHIPNVIALVHGILVDVVVDVVFCGRWGCPLCAAWSVSVSLGLSCQHHILVVLVLTLKTRLVLCSALTKCPPMLDDRQVFELDVGGSDSLCHSYDSDLRRNDALPYQEHWGLLPSVKWLSDVE
eukprot:427030-Rhodomonas_salina.1